MRISTSKLNDENIGLLDTNLISEEDHALALRHAPFIRFDSQEPFLPSVVGYTVFRSSARSPSFPREIQLASNVTCVIEYAIWWDWDIQHLYELEHIWVYLNEEGEVVSAEASWHGGYHLMVSDTGMTPKEENRVTLHSEPGKHAFAPSPSWLIDREPKTTASCGIHSGKMGVHVTPLFKGMIEDRTPLNNRLAHTYLERHAFKPSYVFSRRFDLSKVTFVPWENLFGWIPSRVRWWTEQLRDMIRPEEQRVLRIAHRGASAYAQEGSLSSIRKAADLAADMVEIDIRFTADDIPVIVHDPYLKNVFGVEGIVSELTLGELHDLTPDNREPIMTFDELARECTALGLGIYLDIKELNPDAFESIMNSLREYSLLKHSIFGSHRPDYLAEIKAETPEAVTSILFHSIHVDPVLLARSIDCDYVHPCWERFETPHQFLEGEWIRRVRDAGLGVVCWHEERPSEIAALQALGVDGICSDQPELLIPSRLDG